jgi:hypothetical protein
VEIIGNLVGKTNKKKIDKFKDKEKEIYGFITQTIGNKFS